ncbi:MAG: hypothetical protein QM785_13160 [Pyrinomonadaceae bacterium]
MSLSRFFLFLFVVVVGLEIGAGLYETLVVLPMWALNAPDSVVAFYQHNQANPDFAINAGGRFWIFLTPLVGLVAIITLLTGLKTTGSHRKWRTAGTVIAIVVVTVTFAWFVPNLLRLLYHVPEMTSADIATTANRWYVANWGRVVVGMTAWLCGLRALSISEKPALD